MTADFLLELLSEEIPARMQDRAREDLARLFADELAKAGLAADAIETWATPRRLTLVARGFPLATEPVREEVKGPRVAAPPQALEGFLRKTGLAREQLVERDGVLFAVTERVGRATAAVLAEAIPAIVRDFPWPKSMRWGEGPLRWVRPLQGIVALLGEEVVPCAVGDIRAGAATVGHRFHHPGVITIGSAADYFEKLRACHVIVDQAERRRIIAEGAARLAADEGLALVPDAGLVAENAGLTEWPVPLLGRFDPAFLAVPPEVIQLTMRTNQKYFACRDGDGRLAPAFVCTANLEAADGGAAIVAGNAKVLAARLADARFFWEQDLKTLLETHAAKLKDIVFHEKLGTVADKVERVARLARWLVEEGIIKPSPLQGRGLGEGESDNERNAAVPTSAVPTPPLPASGERERLADLAERAARLCKADLVTGMVGEFPELQGVMGGYYARTEGLPPEVADAIRDHYKPVGQGDEVPTAPVTVAVSLADKLDTLTAFFSINEKPTGSKDPYALRRAALAAAALILSSNLRLDLRTALTFAASLTTFADQKSPLARAMPLMESAAEVSKAFPKSAQVSWDEIRSLLNKAAADANADADYFMSKAIGVAQDVISSIIDRLKIQQREAGVRHDLIDAVFALGGEDDLVRLLARVRALQAFVGTDDGANLLAGYKRAANILRKEGWTGADGEKMLSYTPPDAEDALIAALDRAEPAARVAVAEERFEDAMTALASLRGPIDAFFESVTVNDPDAAVRAHRLGLLARVRDAVGAVADFSKIEGG